MKAFSLLLTLTAILAHEINSFSIWTTSLRVAQRHAVVSTRRRCPSPMSGSRWSVLFSSASSPPGEHARALPTTVRLRGTVVTGYGRGGKRLGFPTANLPSILFQDALQDVEPGVYFGFASIEGRDNQPYKAVVNVGYSPTFTGQENKEKIVEAHLMVDEELEDFHGETMRLQLTGFLREEIKFPSLPDLIAQITADVVDAKVALDKAPYVTSKSDEFLDTSKPWIGKTGGDEAASWEFQKN